MFSPLTIARYVFSLCLISSDLTVNISCNVCAAPYPSRAQTSISPNLCPPNCALPPNGCFVTSEYDPVDLACILSSTKWCNFNTYIIPTVTGLSNLSPVLPSYRYVLPSSLIPAILNSSLISTPDAPSNIGVANLTPSVLATSPK